MPAPRFIGQFNRLVSNPLLAGVARILPGFGVVQHRGRKSGRLYQNPVCVFRYGSLYTIALTYGPESDWVRNVLAGDGCTLITQGRNQKLKAPYLLFDSKRRAVPPLIARILGLMRVDYFLELRAAP
jgi:deazaflavin-dependent oxidoreductase (nitroreductase family)